jgi:hypothetical protein
MKRVLLFFWRIFRRGLRLLVISSVAVVAGYWLGKHSVAGSFSAAPSDPAALTGDGQSATVKATAAPPKEMSLRHRLALLLQNSGVMSARLTVELHSMSAQELREALKIAETWPGGTGSYLYDRTVEALTWQDPERALNELLSQKPSFMRGVNLATLMGLWARRDPVAAYQKWETSIANDEDFKKGNFTGQSLGEILPWLALKDPALAMAKVRDRMKAFHEDNTNFGAHQAMSRLSEKLAADPRQRELLIRELLKPENADANILWNGLPALFRTADYTDPATLHEAMSWVENPAADIAARSAILSGVLDARMKNESQEATAEWYLDQAEKAGVPTPEAFYQVVSKWSGRDLNACGEWLNHQEPGPWLDNALVVFARAAAGEDLSAAFAWAARISRQDQRLNTLELVWVQTLRRHSTAQKREALRNSPVTPADQQALEASLPLWQ